MNSFFKNSSIYLISNIINATIPFLLLPILTRYLSPDEYGQIAMFQVLVTGLSAFIGMNTVGAAARNFYEKEQQQENVNYNVACFFILIITTLITLLLAISLIEPLSSFLSIPTSWIVSAIGFSFFSYIINFRLTQWQVRKKAFNYGIMQVFRSFLNVILSLVFIILLEMGAKGRVDGQLISSMIFSAIALFLLFKSKIVNLSKPKREHLKSAFNFGFPLVPHIFGAFLLTSIDRVVIKEQLGLNAAGIYLLAVQFSMVLSIIFDAINKAYVPWLYENLNKECDKIKSKVVKNTYLYFIILMIISGLGFLIGPFVIEFVAGEQYQEASKIIGWLVLGQIFGGMYLMVTNYVFYSKKTKLLSLITISSGLLNVGLLYLFIPSFGLIGAAYSFVVSYFIRFVFVWGLAAKEIKMPWLLFLQKG